MSEEVKEMLDSTNFQFKDVDNEELLDILRGDE